MEAYINESSKRDQSSVSSQNMDHQPVGCPSTIHETVCVQAEVTVTPDIKVGDIKVFCKDGSMTKKRRCKLKKACVFLVNQKICVEIPLSFVATAKAEPKGIICGIPQKGKCPEKHDCKQKVKFLKSLFKSNLFKALSVFKQPSLFIKK